MKADSADNRRITVTTYKSMSDRRFIKAIERLAKQNIKGIWIADEMHNLASGDLIKTMRSIGETFSKRMGCCSSASLLVVRRRN